jgi:hypothetical protein
VARGAGYYGWLWKWLAAEAGTYVRAGPSASNSPGVSFSIKDIGTNGIKIENNDVGQITGKYQANFMETVSIHMKTDGTSE